MVGDFMRFAGPDLSDTRQRNPAKKQIFPFFLHFVSLRLGNFANHTNCQSFVGGIVVRNDEYQKNTYRAAGAGSEQSAVYQSCKKV